MRNIILILLVTFIAGAVFGQTGSYTLASVPEALRAKASIVTYVEDFNYEVESLEKAWLTVHKIYTVVNEEGKDGLIFSESSSKNILLDDAEIKVYDANGKRIGRYTKKDMATVAIGEGLIVDGFGTFFKVDASSYPVTIELNYTKKYKSTLSVPDYWFISPNESVLSSSFTAKIPAGINLRFKPINTDIKPVITDKGTFKEFKWMVKDMAPVEYEQGAGSSAGSYPHVILVNDQFSHYGYAGDFSSWNSFGTWLRDLYKGLDELPADRAQFYADMVKDIPVREDKIRKIYDYLQQNFRYVSIQLGIGGLQPLPAAFTDAKKYGDCKGLSNFMKAALKAVGIRSHVAIINSQYNDAPADPAFPANGFNHAILCVPGEKDSIWLECTSNLASFGELGGSTENRNALLVTDNGGALVATPKSRSAANQLITRSVVKLESDFSALTETTMKTSGSFRPAVIYFNKEKRDQQKQAVVNYWGFKLPDDFVFTKNAETVRLEMAYRKMHEFNSGDKYFFSPRICKLWKERLPKADNRRTDYYFEEPFEKHDTTIYKLPAGAKPDALPKDKDLTCAYGRFITKWWYNEAENAVYIASSLVLSSYKIPASEYASVKKFFDDVTADDSQKLVIKKSETSLKAF